MSQLFNFQKPVSRIPYGSETKKFGGFYLGDDNSYGGFNRNEACHGCDTKVGELHYSGCHIEQCPICKDQLLVCGHANKFWSGYDEREHII